MNSTENPAMYSPQTSSFNTSVSNVSEQPEGQAGRATVPGHGVHILLLLGIPPIVLMGTVGNMLCIIVLKRKAMQTTPSSTYLMCLAAADSVVLYVSAAKTWIRLVSDFELLHVADSVCRVLKYTFMSSTYLSAWLVVFLSLERFLVVSLPFYASSLVLVRRPGIVTLFLTIAILIINVNVIWASKLVGVGKTAQCVQYSSNDWMCKALPLMNLLLYNALPSLLILSLNAAIIMQVLRSMHSARQARLLTESSSSSKSGATLTGTGSGGSTGVTRMPHSALSSRTQRRLTATLAVICVSWFILSTPYCLADNIKFLQKDYLFRSIAYLLLYMNHAINFYIYCLTGQKFRRELQRTFGCYTPRSRNRRKHKFVAQPKQRTPPMEEGQKSAAARDLEQRSRQGKHPSAHLYN